MSVEEMLVELREKLVNDYGAQGATYLMDRPSGVWSQLVTIPVLDARLDALRSYLRSEMSELRTEMAELRGELRGEMAGLRAELHHELRSQTWRLVTALIASQAMFAAIVGAVVRFT